MTPQSDSSPTSQLGVPPSSTTAPATPSTELPHLGMLLSLVVMRRKDYDKQRDEAIQQQRWSQVAGLDGIGTGLLMAEKLIKEEIKEAQMAQLVESIRIK